MLLESLRLCSLLNCSLRDIRARRLETLREELLVFITADLNVPWLVSLRRKCTPVGHVHADNHAVS